MTFSIVAIDRDKGETGFAISSCCGDAGQVCAARPEGAITSQAKGNVGFLREFFDKLNQGLTTEQIMRYFRETDPDIEARQIGMITITGDNTAFTGKECSYWCGHKTGGNYACQGNILVGPEVIDAMATAFEESQGPLYERLFTALGSVYADGGFSCEW